VYIGQLYLLFNLNIRSTDQSQLWGKNDRLREQRRQVSGVALLQENDLGNQGLTSLPKEKGRGTPYDVPLEFVRARLSGTAIDCLLTHRLHWF
jgi:hypothetical protein